MPEGPSSVTVIPTVDDIIKEVERFRILVIGRSGVGKSSLINKVFGIDGARVENHKAGEAEIEQEHESPQNPLFVSHDSKGFEPGQLENFEVVRKFVEERSKKLLLKDRIHALWLCVETPAAGGRVFETGDEELLKLAQDKNLPLVLVFTQYDRLVRTGIFRLREQDKAMNKTTDKATSRRQSVEKAQETFGAFLKSLKELPIKEFVKVSVRPEFQDVSPISSLVEVTTTVARDRVRGDAWVLWAMAQRKSFPSKIEASITKGIDSHLRALTDCQAGVGEWTFGVCLEKLHKDIITCWSFKGEILNSPKFQTMMLHLVQGINDVNAEREVTNPLTFDKVNNTLGLAKSISDSTVSPFSAGLEPHPFPWLHKTSKDNFSEARRVLIAYTVDLIKVLREVFKKTIESKHDFTTTMPDLEAVFEAYVSSSCQSIHESIRSEKRGTTSTSADISGEDISGEIRRLVGNTSLEGN